MARSPRNAYLAAAGLAAAGVITWLITFLVPGVDSLDASALHGFVDLKSPSRNPTYNDLASLADPQPFILIGLAFIAIAIARGRPRVAALIPFVMIGANVTTQILKPALGATRHTDFLGQQIAAGSWPSGHSTAAMTVALCGVVVVPRAWRPLAAVAGTAFALAVSFSLLALAWHYPSDVFAGYLVAATWTTLGLALVWEADRRWPPRTGRAAVAAQAQRSLEAHEVLAPTGLAAAGTLVLAGLVVLARPERTIAYAQEHTVWVVVVLAIAALATSLASGLALALRR